MTTINRQVSVALEEKSGEFAKEVVLRHFALHPELDLRYGKAGRDHCLRDAAFHLSYLAQAVGADSRELFNDYAAWAKVMLASRGVPGEDLAGQLSCIREILAEQLPPEFHRLAFSYLDEALTLLPGVPEEPPSFMAPDTPLAALATQYLRSLLDGERHVASRLILDAVAAGVGPREIYLQVFQPSQQEIGRLWQLNRISVAQEHYCTAATQLIMSQLYPHIFANREKFGTLVAAGVAGDMHEIGARMVSDFFELAGWRTHYLGTNVPVASLIMTLVQQRAGLLAISATLTSNIRTVEALITAVRRTPACRGVKILVGGYPFNIAPDLWKLVGGDGFARDAQAAVAVGEQLADAQIR